MKSNCLTFLILSLEFLALGVANVAYSAASVQQLISDQRARQIARQVTDSITSRVTVDMDSSFPDVEKQNPKGASADGVSFMPDTVWSTFSWSNISNHASTTPFNTNLYQINTGMDKKIGDFYLGLVVTYVRTNLDTGPFSQGAVTTVGQGFNNLAGVTPYFAYVINKNFFISGLTGYNSISEHFNDANSSAAPSTIDSRSDTDSYKVELNLNGLQVIGQWFVNGKTGTRFQHSSSKMTVINSLLPGSTISYVNGDSLTYLTTVEGGYAFKNGIKTYTGLLYEYAQVSHATNKGVFYYHAGIDYLVNQNFSLGLKVQTGLTDQQVDITTVGLSARLLLD